MAVNLTPWNGLDVEKLKVWVHRILPLVYDDSLSYYEVLAKVSAKMNEVIEGLNANNEQVERVTDFTIEQVQNLTAAFNNFQQSMLNRQEEFENKVLDSQQSFETQLNGDIANWEAETEEKFQNMYDKFLQDYQRHFGVVQLPGYSTTDVLSQAYITRNAFLFRSYTSSGDFDFNTALASGFYTYFNVNLVNAPNGADNRQGILFTFQRNFVEKGETSNYQLQVVFNFINGNFQLVASRAINHDVPGEWQYPPKPDVPAVVQLPGYSTTDVLSQAYITRNAFLFRSYTSSGDFDFNTALASGFYTYFNVNLVNAPNGADNRQGILFTFQRNFVEKGETSNYQLQVVFNFINGNFQLVASRAINHDVPGEWQYPPKPDVLAGKSLVVIGDSWSAYPDWIPDNYKTWYPDHTSLKLNEIWWYKLAVENKMNIYQINAYSGSTIAVDENNPNTTSFITRVTNLFSKSITQSLKPDYYVILGGANDHSRNVPPGNVTYTFTTETDKQSIPALAHCIDLLKTYNPNSKIFVFAQPDATEEYTNGFSTVCSHYNVHFEVLPNPERENYHPTADGQNTVYETIAKTLKLYS